MIELYYISAHRKGRISVVISRILEKVNRTAEALGCGVVAWITLCLTARGSHVSYT